MKKNTKLFLYVLFFLSSLVVTSQSLIFSYDLSGNQKQRFYCPNPGSCTVPTPPAGKFANEEKVVEEIMEDNDIDNQLKMYPNPTKSIVYIQMQSDLHNQIESINVYNSNSTLLKNLNKGTTNLDLQIDLTGLPTGIYFLHIHRKNANSITKKIIKE